MYSGSLGLCFAALNQDSCLTMLLAALSVVLNSSYLKMDKADLHICRLLHLTDSVIATAPSARGFLTETV